MSHTEEDEEEEETQRLLEATSEFFDDDIEMQSAVVSTEMGLYREQALFRRRWDDTYLIGLAEREGSFVAEYRMDLRGFDILTQMLEEVMPVDNNMAIVKSREAGSDPISIHSKLGAALIILGGGRVMESMRTHGLSKSYTYANLRAVVRAINKHPALAIRSGNSSEYCKEKAKAFQNKSSYGIFKYCTGCIDGLAISIKAPNRKRHRNQRQFRSGSKKKTCINVQAVCDGDYIFQAMTAKHVGSTNDADCFETSSLKQLNQSLPFPYHWNADAAYTTTESMHGPFPGINLHVINVAQDSYNFYQSQLRIMIEQAFDMFIQMFGIFWKSSSYDLDFFLEIIHCCFRLYNFIKRRKISCSHAQRQPPHHARLDEEGRLVDNVWRQGITAEDFSSEVRTGCTLRDRIVEEIIENNYFHRRSHQVY